MQCYKEDFEEPMETGDSNILSKHDDQKSANKASRDHEALMQEALLFAEKLNDRLKSLNEEDAELFMENYERHVVLLPKKKNAKVDPHEQLTSQTSNESTHDYVMIDSNEPKNAESNSIVLDKDKPIFGTSIKPSQQNVSKEAFSPVEVYPESHQRNFQNMDDARNNKALSHQTSWTQQLLSEDLKHPPPQKYTIQPRSISVERQKYSTSNPHQERSYSDALQGKRREQSTTTFSATLLSNGSETTKRFSNVNCMNHVADNSNKNINIPAYSSYKPRSHSSHGKRENSKSLNAENYNFNNQQISHEQVHSNESRQVALEAVPTQVENVTQHKNDWLQGNSTLTGKADKKSINILVLGQTGVGKSTWINAFANYLTYSTLEEAIAAEAPVCVIPTKFTLFDDNYQRRDVLLGNHSNEVFSDKGQSATQNAKTYLFEQDDYNLYIIDTPGMDDTRGPHQDDENVQKILRAVAPFKELHAICFLFKANEARLTQSFKYCISKLLGNLSKSALNNTCFVFTNARGTFYKPGDTMGPLKAYFQELQQKENLSVTINDANTFCLDNEAFRFICAYFSKFKFGDHEFKTYADSWKHSANEVKRLLDHAGRIRPHSTSETLSINETRTWILQLINPIIDVSSIVEENLHQLDAQIRDLEATKYNIIDLQKRANIPMVSIDVIQLSSPQTVCGSEKCVEYQEVSGKWQQIYKTVCHENCSISYGDPSQIPDPGLKDCSAFNNSNNCRKCKCSINYHKRIFYKQQVVTRHLETQILQNSLASEIDASKLKRKMIKRCRGMIEGYQRESDFVMNAMAKFSLFLYQNGISQRSDIFEKHLQNRIEAEERMLRTVRHCNDKTYNQLIDILLRYQSIRDQLIQMNHSNKISLSEIQDIRQKLFALPLVGPTIVKIFDIHVEVDKHDYAHSITVCDKKSMFKQFFNWTKNQVGQAISFLAGHQK